MDYIAVDWGSSNFRATLVKNGKSVKTVQSPAGVGKFDNKADLEKVLVTELSRLKDLFTSDLPIVMCGMVGSNLGITDVGYIELPAPLKAIETKGIAIKTNIPNPTYIKPGIACLKNWDVCRGEELQVLGAASRFDSDIYVAAGTHSKWIHVTRKNNEPVITSLNTILTGEMYQIILNHSLVGKGLPAQKEEKGIFLNGVKTAEKIPLKKSNINSELFKCRARYLLGDFKPENLASFLSGLLIGYEIISMHKNLSKKITIIASNELLNKYRTVCDFLKVDHNFLTSEEAVILGFNRIFNDK